MVHSGGWNPQALRAAHRLNRDVLGVLSDTHDNVAAAAAGIAALRAAGAQFLIHCGDVGGERILDLLAGHPQRFRLGEQRL